MEASDPTTAPSAPHSHAEPFPVAVLMGREAVRGNPWLSVRWVVLGVVAGGSLAAPASRTLVHEDGDAARYLYTGFSLRLYPDELESYYHNLLSEHPSAFVVCTPADEGELRPVHTTLSYDEASAYSQGEAQAFRVPLPAELYRWLEAYVVENYAPEQPKKRQRTDWKGGPSGACPT